VSSASTQKVALAPNLIGAALIDPAARRVMEAWRDGKFVVVVNRELIALHLRAVSRIGLGPELVRRWAYWLSAPEKTLLIDKQFGARSVVDLCEEIVKASQAKAIVCWRYPSGRESAPWMMARDLSIGMES
jgi:hypothetical protein